MILKAYGIGAGAEVIVPGNSFVATYLAVSRVGATVVPVDPDEKTFNIDPDEIRSAVTENSRAIIPVHLFGQPADMDAIREIAVKHDLRVIEDAAQAHGASFRGASSRKPGRRGSFQFLPDQESRGVR